MLDDTGSSKATGERRPPDEAPGGEEGIRSELDARQDQVLQLLDELNEQIEAVIREFAPPAVTRGAPPASPPLTRSAA